MPKLSFRLQAAKAVDVWGDINITNTGATTAQPALISGKSAALLMMLI